MVQQFVDREDELKFLEGAYKSDNAQLIVIYGRRRVGKTELINKFCERGNKPHIYHLCTEDSEKNNLEMLRDRFADFLSEPLLRELKLESWHQLFQRSAGFFGKKEGRTVIVIDEFPFLISINRGIVSAFQKIWDDLLSKKNVMLILSGSSISMMENEVLSYKSPLYGRRTGQWKVDPLGLKPLHLFFPAYTPEELTETYCVLGGVPAYLLEFDNNKALFENIREKILQKGRYLYQEADFLLKQEFREPRTYLAILKKIALGYTSLGKLCAATGMDKGNISKYLYTLEGTQIIKHVLPLGKRKGGIHLITDPFFNFWLKMVSPYQAELEAGNTDNVLQAIKKDFPQHMGKMFEAICEKQLPSLKLPIRLTSVNRWWHKDKEIDLVCLDENKKEAMFVECKWSALNEKEARKILEELKAKSAFVQWKRKKEQFGLIAKKITGKGKDSLRKQGFYIWSLEDIFSHAKFGISEPAGTEHRHKFLISKTSKQRKIYKYLALI